ncbi:MAG: cation diffusion facilitator family transporter [Myxococcota bacterium]
MTDARQARQERAAERNRAIRIVLWAVLAANWVVAGAKLALGLVIDSTAMTADGLHSFIDGGSNVIGLVAMHFASQPADREHPYGHQKFEALAALAIGVMIGMGVLELGRMAWSAIVHGVHPTVGPEAIAVMVVTLALNLAVTRVERSWGEKLGSALLLADAKHTLSDVFVTSAVIASLVLSWLGVGRADGVVALGVLVFVAWTGWTIISQAVGILADSARIDPAKVCDVVQALPHVLAVRDVRSRGMEGSVYVDLKIDVDPGLSVEDAHHVSDEVEKALTRAFPEVVDVVVHVEPQAR